MADNQSNKVLKKKKLEIRHRTLGVFKNPAILFPPNAPHQAMGVNHPNMTILCFILLLFPKIVPLLESLVLHHTVLYLMLGAQCY